MCFSVAEKQAERLSSVYNSISIPFFRFCKILCIFNIIRFGQN